MYLYKNGCQCDISGHGSFFLTAIKINSFIVAERSKTLSNLENATPKQLCAAVDRTGKYVREPKTI